jgi:hypothetical protein
MWFSLSKPVSLTVKWEKSSLRKLRRKLSTMIDFAVDKALTFYIYLLLRYFASYINLWYRTVNALKSQLFDYRYLINYMKFRKLKMM